MKKILLIGATGQLGTRVFEKLNAMETYSLRILVREDSDYEHLKSVDPEIVIGDLKDRHSLKEAVEGCDIIITTANSAVPRKKGDSFKAVDIEGFRNLIEVAMTAGIAQFIYTSAYLEDGHIEGIPLAESKAATESYIKASGIPYTIFRPDLFMDVHLAFMGTDIPIRGEKTPTIGREFKFMKNFFDGIRGDIANGKFNMVGKGTSKHSYIALENVADFIVKAVDNPDMLLRVYELGGPETLSALEVKAIFEKVLGKTLKIKRTPTFMMNMLGQIASLFNPAIANIFKLNYFMAISSSKINCQPLAEKLGIELISVEQYLRAKLSLEENLMFDNLG